MHVLVPLALMLSCSPGRESLVERLRLKEHPAVPGGSPLEPRAVVLSIDGRGHLFKDGSEVTLAEIAAVRSGPMSSIDPVLIEAPRSMTIAECTPLLRAVIERARCRNISFLVSSPSGPGALTIPVIADDPVLLTYTIGRVDYTVRDQSDEARFLWLTLRVESAGGFTVTEIMKKRFNEVWFPDPKNPESTDPRVWKGSHPKLGPWSIDELTRFLEGIKPLEAYVDLQVLPQDNLQDFLKCFHALNQVVEGRTIVSFRVS